MAVLPVAVAVVVMLVRHVAGARALVRIWSAHCATGAPLLGRRRQRLVSVPRQRLDWETGRSTGWTLAPQQQGRSLGGCTRKVSRLRPSLMSQRVSEGRCLGSPRLGGFPRPLWGTAGSLSWRMQ